VLLWLLIIGKSSPAWIIAQRLSHARSIDRPFPRLAPFTQTRRRYKASPQAIYQLRSNWRSLRGSWTRPSSKSPRISTLDCIYFNLRLPSLCSKYCCSLSPMLQKRAAIAGQFCKILDTPQRISLSGQNTGRIEVSLLGERCEGQVIIRFRIVAIFAAAVLSACSALPGAGPDLFTTASVADLGGGPRVIDIDGHVISTLRSGTNSSLTGFSQYQPTSAPVIGIGDIVRVNIWEAAPGNLFNASSGGAVLVGSAGGTVIPDQVVQPGGTINVPFAGDIKVAGKLPREVETAVVRKLSSKAVDPQALVSVTKSAANSVTVTGDAVPGGMVQLSPSNERILDAISMVGGIRTPINDTYISLSRGGKVVTVPFLVLTKSAEENIRLSPRDVLSVYGHRRTYTILGAAHAQSDIPFDMPSVTLAQAIGRA